MTDDDTLDSIAKGVRQGIVDLGTNWGQKDLPHEIIHDAVRLGMREAIWMMITNATDAPCADFYEAVRQGVNEALRTAIANGSFDPSEQ